jgi:hypothetical protein
MDERQ